VHEIKDAVLRSVVAFSLMASAIPAASSSLPPPPEYAWSASKILADASIKDQARVAPLFAEDVQVTKDGKPLAAKKAEWMSFWFKDRKRFFGKTVLYSMGRRDAGVLLVLDQFDTRDDFTNPPPPGEAQWSTRSTLYAFGPDGLVHSVQISEVDSFLIKADSEDVQSSDKD